MGQHRSDGPRSVAADPSVSRFGDYRSHFAECSAAAHYDDEQYGPGSYGEAIWPLQRPIVRARLEWHLTGLHAPKVCDVACGTGRIVAEWEQLIGPIDAVDISSAMIERARSRGLASRFVVADITAESPWGDRRFDVITAFRLVGNAGEDLRRDVLSSLRRIVEPDGVVLLDLHTSSRSARGALAASRALVTRQRSPLLHPAVLEREARDARFRVARRTALAIAPGSAYGSPLAPIARRVDRFGVGRNLHHIASDVLYELVPC
jgi:SAM-dependent methyltransferase